MKHMQVVILIIIQREYDATPIECVESGVSSCIVILVSIITFNFKKMPNALVASAWLWSRSLSFETCH